MSECDQQRADIEHCRREIADLEAQILAGHPDLEGLCLALSDWRAELRLLQGANEGTRFTEMLRIHRRIEKLQKVFGLSDREPSFEHRIVFIDSDGSVGRKQLLISPGRMEWIEVDVAEQEG